MTNVNINLHKKSKHERSIHYYYKTFIYVVRAAMIAVFCGFSPTLGKVQARNANLPQRVPRIYTIRDIGHTKNTASSVLPIGNHQVLSGESEDMEGITPSATKACYFDRSQLCSRRGLCEIDDRPCGANRKYLDHEYKRVKSSKPRMDTSRLEKLLKIAHRPSYHASDLLEQNLEKRILSVDESSKSVLEEIFGVQAEIKINKVANKQHQDATTVKTRNAILLPYMLLSRHERKLRRKRLFLMSTWIEDLLPDPHQGRDPLTNAAADAMKISIRAVQVLLSLCRLGPHPPRVTF
jgi:hypothetical protein